MEKLRLKDTGGPAERHMEIVVELREADEIPKGLELLQGGTTKKKNSMLSAQNQIQHFGRILCKLEAWKL